MSRLTCKCDGENVLRELCAFDRESNTEADGCFSCGEYCNNKDMNCERCAIQKAFDKLAEYEELEEKGLLLKLPYNIANYGKIYFVDENDLEIYELLADKIEIYKMMISEKFVYTIDSFDFFYEDFGKTVFLTKEEAEQELKRLECAE